MVFRTLELEFASNNFWCECKDKLCFCCLEHHHQSKGSSEKVKSSSSLILYPYFHAMFQYYIMPSCSCLSNSFAFSSMRYGSRACFLSAIYLFLLGRAEANSLVLYGKLFLRRRFIDTLRQFLQRK